MRRLMSWKLALLWTLCFGLAHSAMAQRPKRQKLMQNPKRIALVNAGAVDEDLFKKIHAHLESNLEVPVRSLSAPAGPTDDLLVQVRTWKALMTEDDVCFVVLANSARDVREYLLLAPDHRWAMVIANAVVPEDGDQNKYLWRLQRLCMRGVAFLFGMGFSPNARSVNAPCASLAELDMIGTNFDPPSHDKFLEEAMQRGLRPEVKEGPRRRRRKAAKSVPSTTEPSTAE